MLQVSKRSKRLFAFLVGFMMIVSQSSYLSLNKVYAETNDPGSTETVYMLTDTLKAGQNYIVANSDSGSVSVLERDSKDLTYAKADVTSDDNGTYIKASSDDVVWKAEKGSGSGAQLVNGDFAVVLDEENSLAVGKDATDDMTLWSYDSGNQYLAADNGGDSPTYMVFAKGFEASNDGDEVYLYVESEINTGEDEDADSTRGPPEAGAATVENENTPVEDEDTTVKDEDTTAEKEGTVLAFTSDIHNNGAASGGYVADTAAIRLDNWMDKVVNMYGGIDVMSFCGDMGVASSNQTTFWDYTQNVMNVVNGKKVKGVYTTGNHEFYNGKYGSNSNSVTEKYKVGAEGIEGNNYRIYCLGTDNWDNYKDNYTTAQVNKLSDYLSAAGTDKPIIVLTHYPLHTSSSRSSTNADLVIDALNDAADSGKKVVLLWGHNHSVQDDNYDQIFEPGSTLKYGSGSNDKKDIDFYYAAAGCMSDSEVGTGSNFVKGKGLVITINSQDQLTFAYYNADGTNVTEGGTYTEGDPINATAISVSPKTLTVEVGSSEDLTVSFTPADTTNRKVNWTSSEPSIATVSSGKVTGVAPGTATITATYADTDIQDTCEVKVTKAPGQGVTPENGKKYVVLAGDGYALTSEGDEVGYTNGSSGSQQYHYNGLTGEKYTVGQDVIPERLLWTFTESEDGTGYYIQSQDGKYLNGTYVSNDSGGYDGTLKLDETPDVWVISGTSSGSKASTSILKSTNASQSDAGDKYLTHGNGSESTENIFTMRSEDNATTTKFFEYGDDGTYVEDDIVIPFGPDPDDPTPTDGNVYKLVNQFTDGKDYLIVSKNSTGSAYALTNPGGNSSGADMGRTEVTVKSGDVDGDGTADTYISAEEANIVWKAAANEDGYNITNGKDYLEGKSGNVKIYNSQQYTDRYWTYSGNQLKHNGGQNTYTVYYDNKFTSTYNSSSNKIYIYEKVAGGTTPDDPTPDDPTPAEGTHYKEVNTLEDGHEYIIAATKGDGSVYAVKNTGDDYISTVTLEMTEASGDDAAYIITEDTGVLWNYKASDKYFSNDKKYLYPTSSNSIRTYSSGRAIDYADGKMSFATSSSGTYYITCSDGSFATSNDVGDAATIRIFTEAEGTTPDDPTPDDPTPTDGNVYKLVNQFTDGKDYLIVSKNSTGSAYALTNPGGSSSGADMGRTGVTVKSGDVDGDGSSDTYISAEETDIVWKATAHEDVYNITNGTDYLEGKSGNVKIFSSQQYAERGWTYEGNQLQHKGGQNTYTVYYDSKFTSTYDSTDSKIYIYEKVAGGTTPDDPTPDDPTPVDGNVYKLVNQFTDGKDYLIVSKNSTGSAYALTNPGGNSDGADMGRTEVTVKSGDVDGDGTADTYISAEETNIVWKATAHDGVFNITNGTDYLEGKRGNVKIFSSQQYAERGWKYTDAQLQHVGGDNTYTVYYDSKFTSTYNSSSNKIYIYEKTVAGTHEHDWEFTGFAWTGDDENGYTAAAANYKCTIDPAHTDTVEVEVQSSTTEATCTTPGKVVYTVTVSDEESLDNESHTESKTVQSAPATGHKWGKASYTWADDFTSVKGSHICDNCSVAEEETASAEGEITVAATCTETGVMTYTSEAFTNKAFSAQTITAMIPARGHDLKHHAAAEATCENEGNIEYWTCEREGCGKYFSDAEGKTEITAADTVIEKKDHSWDEGTVTTEPTCTEKGVRTFKCSTCGATRTEDIPALGHKLIHHPAVAATCTSAGNSEYWECSECGNYFSDKEGNVKIDENSWIIGAAGHNWKHIVNKAGLLKDGVEYDQCTVCKATKNRKVLPGYAGYYVKSLKVTKSKQALTVKWAKQSKANQKKFNGYQIRYSKNANMSRAKYAAAGKSSKSKKIKKLAKKTRYYVQVRTYTTYGGKTFYSNWSPVKSVVTK